MMGELLRIPEIARKLGISEAACRKRASREHWFCIEQGREKLYPVCFLPQETRKRLASTEALNIEVLQPVEGVDGVDRVDVVDDVDRVDEVDGVDRVDFPPSTNLPALGNHHDFCRGTGVLAIRPENQLTIAPTNRIPSSPNLPETAKRAALAKYQLIHAFRKHLDAASWGKKKEAGEDFVLAYRTGYLLPGVHQVIGDVTVSTLRRDSKLLETHGDDYTVLADGRGGWKKYGGLNRQERKLSKPAQEAFLRCYLQQTQPSVHTAIRAALVLLSKQGIEEPAEETTWRRWLNDYRETSGHVIDMARKGMKYYVDHWAPYITRDDKLLDVGQVLVADGKVLNFLIKHPETGKPCRMALIIFMDWRSRYPVGWQIMPTENTLAILAAFRNAVITLGKYPQCVYIDNGKAFKSRVFTKTDPDLEELNGIYARVGTAVQFALAYGARAKVVERLNLTFQSQLEQVMPTKIGDSIANKPPWLSRNEKFHKVWHEAVTGDWVPTIGEASHLVGRYFEWYGNEPHDGIDGQTPLSLLDQGRGPGVDPSQLAWDFMLRETRTPRRCRISLMGIDFEGDCLHGISHKVVCMYDTADLSRLHCYTTDGVYMGDIWPVEALHPMAKLFGDAVSVDQVSAAVKRQAKLRKDTRQALTAIGAREEDVTALLGLKLERRVAVIQGGGGETKELEMSPEEVKRLEEVYETAKAVEEAEPAEPPEITERRLKLIYDRDAAEEAEARKGPSIPRPEYWDSELHRYDYCFRLRYEHGDALSEEDQLFMSYYEKSDGYSGTVKGRYENLLLLYEMEREEREAARG